VIKVVFDTNIFISGIFLEVNPERVWNWPEQENLNCFLPKKLLMN